MIAVHSNADEFKAIISGHGKAYGFAQVVALTRTAKATAQEFLPGEAKRIFDRPTPYTLNAFWYRPATPDKLTYEIGIKDFGGKGTPATKYLLAEVMGGQRTQKRSERLLTIATGTQVYWFPGPGIKLDAYGNVPGPTMVRILSDIQAQNDALQNRTIRSFKRNKRYRMERYFIAAPDSGLKPGVYVERNGVTTPALIFIKSPGYRKLFDFFDKGMAFAQERLRIELDRAIAQGFADPKSIGTSVAA